MAICVPAQKTYTIRLQPGEILRVLGQDTMVELEGSVDGEVEIRGYLSPLLNWYGLPCELREMEVDSDE